jgi:hypothetical protein
LHEISLSFFQRFLFSRSAPHPWVAPIANVIDKWVEQGKLNPLHGLQIAANYPTKKGEKIFKSADGITILEGRLSSQHRLSAKSSPSP